MSVNYVGACANIYKIFKSIHIGSPAFRQFLQSMQAVMLKCCEGRKRHRAIAAIPYLTWAAGIEVPAIPSSQGMTESTDIHCPMANQTMDIQANKG
jgi:hypothetical protein